MYSFFLKKEKAKSYFFGLIHLLGISFLLSDFRAHLELYANVAQIKIIAVM